MDNMRTPDGWLGSSILTIQVVTWFNGNLIGYLIRPKIAYNRIICRCTLIPPNIIKELKLIKYFFQTLHQSRCPLQGFLFLFRECDITWIFKTTYLSLISNIYVICR